MQFSTHVHLFLILACYPYWTDRLFSPQVGPNACPQISGEIMTSAVPCEPYEIGQAVFIGEIIGGAYPLIFDWDKVSTPWNDDFGMDENSIGLSDVAYGDYYFIVIDNEGCADTMMLTIEVVIAPTYFVDNNPSSCINPQGSITLYNIVGLTGNYSFDWDYAVSPMNDDYGAPPPTIDPQNISNLANGNYYLTITVTDSNSDPPLYTCQYYDTILVPVLNYWTGSKNNAWEDPANWNCGFVPDSTMHAVIPNGVPYFPTVSSFAYCNRLEMYPGASINISTGWMLSVDHEDY